MEEMQSFLLENPPSNAGSGGIVDVAYDENDVCIANNYEFDGREVINHLKAILKYQKNWDTAYFNGKQSEFYEYNSYFKKYPPPENWNPLDWFNKNGLYKVDYSKDWLYQIYLIGDDFNTTGYYATLSTQYNWLSNWEYKDTDGNVCEIKNLLDYETYYVKDNVDITNGFNRRANL